MNPNDLRTRIAAAIDRKYTEEAIGHTYEVCLHAADAVIRELQLTEDGGVIVGCIHD